MQELADVANAQHPEFAPGSQRFRHPAGKWLFPLRMPNDGTRRASVMRPIPSGTGDSIVHSQIQRSIDMTLVKMTALAALLGSTAVLADTSADDQTKSTTRTKTSTTTTEAVTIPEFRSLDTNGDGRVSKAEADLNSTVKLQFAALDTDADGELSTSEYAKGTAKAHSNSRSETTTTIEKKNTPPKE
jgi:hypothetical protein